MGEALFEKTKQKIQTKCNHRLIAARMAKTQPICCPTDIASVHKINDAKKIDDFYLYSSHMSTHIWFIFNKQFATLLTSHNKGPITFAIFARHFWQSHPSLFLLLFRSPSFFYLLFLSCHSAKCAIPIFSGPYFKDIMNIQVYAERLWEFCPTQHPKNWIRLSTRLQAAEAQRTVCLEC